eukprot:TRINITY_DN2509_c0_g1_i2.p1 TRINITY_DN2509_c0_g1~~TRINITY_DN2509_c0_g1_i2.p1  ORF type:complete len:313 (+),score=82.89 TRINITY_DN2509_c0_g1_i2:25-939(+)
MNDQKTLYEIGIPLTGITVVGDYLLASGGGGESKTGVPNLIVGLKIEEDLLEGSCQRVDTGSVTYTALHGIEGDQFVGKSVDGYTVYGVEDGELKELSGLSVDVSEDFVQKAFGVYQSGEKIVTSDSTGLLCFWNRDEEGEYVKEDEIKIESEESISKVEWLSEDKIVILYKERLEIWDIGKKEMVKEILPIGESRLNDLTVSKAGEIFYIQFQPRKSSHLVKYNPTNDVSSKILIHRRIHATSVAVNDDASLIALGGAKGHISVYRNNLSLMTKKKIHDFVVTNVCFEPLQMNRLLQISSEFF